MDSWILRTFMQSKNLSNITQYFLTLAVSDCPYSLRATPTYVLKTYTAWQIFIAKNSVKFICWVVILRHNCNPISKSFKIKSLMWLHVKQNSAFHRKWENILSKPECIRSLRPVLTKSGWSQKKSLANRFSLVFRFIYNVLLFVIRNYEMFLILLHLAHCSVCWGSIWYNHYELWFILILKNTSRVLR